MPERSVIGRAIPSKPEAAEEARGTLAAIVESSADAIVAFTTEGIILTWSRSAEAVFGYSAAEAARNPTSMMAPEERRHGVAQFIGHLAQGNSISQHEGLGLCKFPPHPASVERLATRPRLEY